MTTWPECLNCGEPVMPGETDPDLAHMQNYHRECVARSVLGSVGHILGQCSCYGGPWEDPPLMSKREAARASLALTRAGFVPPPLPIRKRWGAA